MGIRCLWQPSCDKASSNHASMKERARIWAWTCWVGSVLPGSVHYYAIDVLLKCLLFSCTINSSFCKLAKNLNSFFFCYFYRYWWTKIRVSASQHLEDIFCRQWVEQDPDTPSDQPNISDYSCALFSGGTCHRNTVVPLFLTADVLPSDVEVLGFSNYALSEPVSTAERSPQAFTPPYSMTLRYGLASILWLCLGLLQVHRHHAGCSKTSFSVFFFF